MSPPPYVPNREIEPAPVGGLEKLESLIEKGIASFTFVAIDLEWHIHVDPSTNARPITEVGIAVGNYRATHRVEHWIVEEYRDRHNRHKWARKIKDGKLDHKNDFDGTSEYKSIQCIGQELTDVINKEALTGEVVILVHCGKQDNDELAKLGCDINHLPVLDTQKIDSALRWSREGKKQTKSLKNILLDDKLQVIDNWTLAEHLAEHNAPFHNAGNDAMYTMLAFRKLLATVFFGPNPVSSPSPIE